MLFSQDFLFVHIPKTGGNSIKTMLMEAYKKHGKNTYILNKEFNNPHMTLEEVPFSTRNKFKFCLVRSPWQQRVSMYLYNKRKGMIPENSTFEEFLFIHRPDFSISRFICNEGFDQIYQMEKFQDVVQDLQDRLGVRFDEVLHRARADNYDFLEYYKEREDLIQYVTKSEKYLLTKFYG